MVDRRAASADEVRAHSALRSRRAKREPVLPLLHAPLLILRSRLELAAGNIDAADAAVAVTDHEQEGEPLVAAARVALARDDVELAGELLAPVLDGSVRVVYGRARVEAAVLQALTSTRAGDAERGRVWIEHALDMAEPEGMRGPFLDAAPGTAEPLRLAIRRGTAHRWLVAALLAVADGRAADRIPAPRARAPERTRTGRAPLSPHAHVESRDRFELFVSVNTVKTHLKSIYRKLGASHRREAVRRARELRLIA